LLGDDSDRLILGIGGFDLVREASRAGRLGPSIAGQVEYRLGRKYAFFGPLAGLLANGNGGLLGYAGVYVDAQLSRWVVTPFAAAGGYRRGEGKDLGGLFAFHVGATVAYRFDNHTRLGITLTHASNARAYALNPGAESLLVSYAIPIGEGR
jgi:lipid A 3-O-deacylase